VKKEAVMVRTIIVLLSWVACSAASAQAVYKCSSGGKISYGEQPCATGTQTELAVPAAPPPDAALAERLARQKALVESLERERASAAAQAARTARPVAAGAKTPKQQRCDKLRLQLKWAAEDLRKTAGPATEPLRLKFERQAEAMGVECQP
jgi:hypothetical protein